MQDGSSNVIAFPQRAAQPVYHPKALMEAVYAAGSIPVAAEDVSTKTAAVMLQALGFLVIDAVEPDGTVKRLPGKAARTAFKQPWRLLKPPFSGEAGMPDANGAFLRG